MAQPYFPQRELLSESAFIKDLGSSTAILLGIGYTSGFLVVHAYLGSMGVVPFELLSVQYLVAGALFMCAVALVWVPAWWGEMIVRKMLVESREAKESPRQAYWSIFGGRVVGATGGWFLGGLVLYLVGVASGNILIWIAMAYVPHVLLRFSYEWRKTVHQAPPATRFALFGFPLFVVVLVGLSKLFGATIYPQIDRTVGGGQPVRLELEFNQVSQSVPSGPYDVLAVTERYWVMQDTTGTTHYIVSSEQVKMATLRGKSVSVPPRR